MICSLEYLVGHFWFLLPNIQQMAPNQTEPYTTTPFPCLLYVYITSLVLPVLRIHGQKGTGFRIDNKEFKYF